MNSLKTIVADLPDERIFDPVPGNWPLRLTIHMGSLTDDSSVVFTFPPQQIAKASLCGVVADLYFPQIRV